MKAEVQFNAALGMQAGYSPHSTVATCAKTKHEPNNAEHWSRLTTEEGCPSRCTLFTFCILLCSRLDLWKMGYDCSRITCGILSDGLVFRQSARRTRAYHSREQILCSNIAVDPNLGAAKVED